MYGKGMLARTLREIDAQWIQALEPFDVREGEVLADPNRLPRYAYLIDEGLMSTKPVCGVMEGAALMIGAGGLANPQAMLCTDPVATRVTCEVPARGYAVPTQAARAILARSPVSRHVIERYRQEAVSELALGCIALTALDVRERLAVWLLQAAELLGDNAVPLSHARVAALMGVHRRASITEALAEYAGEGVIGKEHGRVVILDEGRLIRHAGRIVLDWKARRTALAAYLERTYSETLLAA